MSSDIELPAPGTIVTWQRTRYQVVAHACAGGGHCQKYGSRALEVRELLKSGKPRYRITQCIPGDQAVIETQPDTSPEPET